MKIKVETETYLNHRKLTITKISTRCFNNEELCDSVDNAVYVEETFACGDTDTTDVFYRQCFLNSEPKTSEWLVQIFIH